MLTSMLLLTILCVVLMISLICLIYVSILLPIWNYFEFRFYINFKSNMDLYTIPYMINQYLANGLDHGLCGYTKWSSGRLFCWWECRNWVQWDSVNMSVHIVCKDALTHVPGEKTDKLETIHLSAIFSSMFGSFDMFHWSLYVWLIDG